MGKRAGLNPRAVKYTGIEQKSTPHSAFIVKAAFWTFKRKKPERTSKFCSEKAHLFNTLWLCVAVCFWILSNCLSADLHLRISRRAWWSAGGRRGAYGWWVSFIGLWCWDWFSPARSARGDSAEVETRSRGARCPPRIPATAPRPPRASHWISQPWKKTWTISWLRWRTSRSLSTRAQPRSSTTTWSYISWRIHQSPVTTGPQQGKTASRLQSQTLGNPVGCLYGAYIGSIWTSSSRRVLVSTVIVVTVKLSHQCLILILTL